MNWIVVVAALICAALVGGLSWLSERAVRKSEAAFGAAHARGAKKIATAEAALASGVHQMDPALWPSWMKNMQQANNAVSTTRMDSKAWAQRSADARRIA